MHPLLPLTPITDAAGTRSACTGFTSCTLASRPVASMSLVSDWNSCVAATLAQNSASSTSVVPAFSVAVCPIRVTVRSSSDGCPFWMENFVTLPGTFPTTLPPATVAPTVPAHSLTRTLAAGIHSTSVSGNEPSDVLPAALMSCFTP